MTKEIGEKSLFSKWYWENWTTTCKLMKLEHTFTPFIEINSKCFKYLNIRQDTIKHLQEYIGKTLWHKLEHFFSSQTPKAKEMKAKVNKYNLIKIKSFAQQSKLSTKWKDNLWTGKKYLQTMWLIRVIAKNINTPYN